MDLGLTSLNLSRKKPVRQSRKPPSFASLRHESKVHHAKYSGYEALFDFDGTIFEGELPVHVIKFVTEWIGLHQSELEDNWQRARTGEPLNYIAPLE